MQASTGRRKPKQRKAPRLGLWAALAIGLLLVGYVLIVANSRPRVSGDRLRLDEFFTLLGQGDIRDARILDQDEYVVGSYRSENGAEATYSVPYVAGAGHTNVVDVLLANQVPTSVDHQFSKRLLGPATLILPALIVVVVFVYLILSYQRGSGLFSVRSGAVRVDGDDPVTFADVAGQDLALTELREITEFLADPGRFAAMGAQVPRGILLYGPPGCGKTLVARALAGETGAAFFSISGSDFVEIYVGVGAARVRDLFREAREHAPAIIFIDELDSVGRRRGGSGLGGGSDEQEQALNQVLAELDGFSPLDGVIVVGATNRPDVLDPALLRPGRFDRSIGLERPDESARLAILARHARNKRLEPSADLASVASRSIGMTGADLASVMNEAALLATRDHHDVIAQADLDQALQRIMQAPERQRRLSLRQASVAKRFVASERVTFADVAGVDSAVEELAEVRDYLAHPEAFARVGAKAPRGILLTGPPGCGKTLLARALAGEANAAFFAVGGSEFVEIYVGVGASRVRDLFAEAAAVAPAIVFIDEIDGVGGHRSSTAVGGSKETEQTLNQILVEMDGFVGTGVIVMAATNRPDMLDPALVRPGRFDRAVAVNAPDLAGRRAILALHTRNKPLAAEVDLDLLAKLTRGMTGADLASLVNESALLAARQRLELVTMDLIEEALDRATIGLSATGAVLSDAERRAVAYHEAGHALVARQLPGAPSPHKVTIVSRGGSLGHCRSLDSHERTSFSRSMLIDVMAVGLAGRMAEILVLGDAMAGSASDLAEARRVARRMVREEAMGDSLGFQVFPDQATAGGTPQYSDDTANAIEAAERSLIEVAGERARDVLIKRRDALDGISAALLERETLTAVELESIISALQ